MLPDYKPLRASLYKLSEICMEFRFREAIEALKAGTLRPHQDPFAALDKAMALGEEIYEKRGDWKIYESVEIIFATENVTVCNINKQMSMKTYRSRYTNLVFIVTVEEWLNCLRLCFWIV